MENLNKLFVCIVLAASTSCSVLRNTTNDNFANGEYRSKIFGAKKVYINTDSVSVVVYKLEKKNGDFVADTAAPFVKIFRPNSVSKIQPIKFNRTTFDFDALTIPFKYRPETNALPQQFTTSLNGAVYFGIRNDNYRLRYNKDFFNYYRREVNHYAISIGGFTGFGSTAMNPWVTEYNINSEYEGVVWLKGVAVIMAVGKFTSGVSIGWDNLLDKNKKYWIYEGKPWVGLVFGLNLN